MAEKAAGKKIAASKRVMDVSRPGKSAPSASSRPVIVGHKPMIKDPMVSEKGAAPATLEEPPKKDNESEKITVRRAKIITPIASDDKEKPADSAPEKPAVPEDKPADRPADASETETSEAAPATEEQSAEPAAETATPDAESTEEQPPATDESPTEEEKPAEESNESPSDDAATVDAVADQVKDKKKAAKESEEERQKAEQVQKLIEEKKYFVPLGQVTKRRHTEWMLVALILLIVGALAFVYVVDAGIFDPGFNLPFDLIKS